MFKKRYIPNFSYDSSSAWKIIKKRLFKFLFFLAIWITIVIVTLLVVYFFTNHKIIFTTGIIMSLLHLLMSITYFVILDNGAANQLRKNNFKVNNQTLKKGHTFYYVLKTSGFIRLAINLGTLMLITGLSVLVYVL